MSAVVPSCGGETVVWPSMVVESARVKAGEVPTASKVTPPEEVIVWVV